MVENSDEARGINEGLFSKSRSHHVVISCLFHQCQNSIIGQLNHVAVRVESPIKSNKMESENYMTRFSDNKMV